MPELPDITVYCEAIDSKLRGCIVESVKVLNPFVLRTVSPSINDIEGIALSSVERLGKQLILNFDNEVFLLVHLMIAGRFRWIENKAGKKVGKPPGGKLSLCGITFREGSLYLTEAGSQRRASIHAYSSRDELMQMDRGGLEVHDCTIDEFVERVTLVNHTLKRTLTDPQILSGIGNAYSDEILHRAGFSPMLQTARMDEPGLKKLYSAIIEVMDEWTARLRQQCETDGGFPKKVTAFRPEMAVHGKFGDPCPVCDSPVQRIVYKRNETNYCARCQTKGTILKDRALSRLLKDSWPGKLE